ncbi:MAG: hypothetical protein Q8876_01240 [Bacillota bacterium]|nr:hypothetical protein [Bacillota bacterium]
MNQYFTEFLNYRIDNIMNNLKNVNSEYAISYEKSGELLKDIDPIIMRNKDITISAENCANFREYLDEEVTQNAIIQQELYKNGYIDCVKLLKMLGVLA